MGFGACWGLGFLICTLKIKALLSAIKNPMPKSLLLGGYKAGAKIRRAERKNTGEKFLRAQSPESSFFCWRENERQHMKKQPAALTYEAAWAEHQQIVQALQDEAVSIDDLAAKIARANELVRFCRERLRATEEELGRLDEV
jgi:exodeoxyribonuclease VII small subunit